MSNHFCSETVNDVTMTQHFSRWQIIHRIQRRIFSSFSISTLLKERLFVCVVVAAAVVVVVVLRESVGESGAGEHG